MKRKIILLATILCFVCACKEKANIILDGSITQEYGQYGQSKVTGYVRNDGKGTAYACMINITCYSDNHITIIGTAFGSPADHGPIGPGQRAPFKALSLNLPARSRIQAFDYKITWRNR